MGDLEKLFDAFSRFENPNSDGKYITLANSDKWMKEANIIDGKLITTTDTAIEFKRFKMNTMDFKHYSEFIELLAKAKRLEPSELVKKLLSVLPPENPAPQPEPSKALQLIGRFTGLRSTRKSPKTARGKAVGTQEKTDGTEKRDH